MSEFNVVSAATLLGDRVKDQAGTDIGRVEELLLEVQSGRTAYAVLSLPQVAEGLDRHYPVPWAALRFNRTYDGFVLQVSPEKLEAAPFFTAGDRPDVSDRIWRNEVATYYSLPPYWQVHPAPVEAAPERPVESPRRSSGGALLLLLLFLVAGAAGYLVYTNGWTLTAASVQQAASEVQKTSGEAATTLKVKTAMALSKRVSAFDINVDTSEGFVTLAGEVPSEEIKSFAGAIAENTSGVQGVHNSLLVNPSAEPDKEIESLHDRVHDLEIQAAIHDLLRENTGLDTSAVKISVHQTRVTLEGTVADLVAKARLEQIVWSAPGVTGVTSNLVTGDPERLRF